MKRKIIARARVELHPAGKKHFPQIQEGEADCEMDVEDNLITQIRRTGPIEPLERTTASSGATSNAYRSGWDAVFGRGKPRAKA